MNEAFTLITNSLGFMPIAPSTSPEKAGERCAVVGSALSLSVRFERQPRALEYDLLFCCLSIAVDVAVGSFTVLKNRDRPLSEGISLRGSLAVLDRRRRSRFTEYLLTDGDAISGFKSCFQWTRSTSLRPWQAAGAHRS